MSKLQHRKTKLSTCGLCELTHKNQQHGPWSGLNSASCSGLSRAYKPKGYGNASSSDQLSQSRYFNLGRHVVYNMIMWEAESTRGSCMRTVCRVVSVCIGVPFWACVCVCFVSGWRVIVWVVIRSCVREAVGCCFEARWDRERAGNIRGKKALQQKSKHEPS